MLAFLSLVGRFIVTANRPDPLNLKTPNRNTSSLFYQVHHLTPVVN